MLKGPKWEISLETHFHDQPAPNLQKELFKTVLAGWQWDEACSSVGQSFIGPDTEAEYCKVASFNPNDRALQKLCDAQLLSSEARNKLAKTELLQKEAMDILQSDVPVPGPSQIPAISIPAVPIPVSLIRKLPKSKIGEPSVKQTKTEHYAEEEIPLINIDPLFNVPSELQPQPPMDLEIKITFSDVV